MNYFVCMHVEMDDYILLEHFRPSNQAVIYAALALKEVEAAGKGLSSSSGPS